GKDKVIDRRPQPLLVLRFGQVRADRRFEGPMLNLPIGRGRQPARVHNGSGGNRLKHAELTTENHGAPSRKGEKSQTGLHRMNINARCDAVRPGRIWETPCCWIGGVSNFRKCPGRLITTCTRRFATMRWASQSSTPPGP